MLLRLKNGESLLGAFVAVDEPDARGIQLLNEENGECEGIIIVAPWSSILSFSLPSPESSNGEFFARVLRDTYQARSQAVQAEMEKSSAPRIVVPT